MNDNETKVMTFSTVTTGQLQIREDSSYADGSFSAIELLSSFRSGDRNFVRPSSGRPFYAGMMFDRLRFRSISVTIRPKVMPSTSATNYIFWAAWDRYGHISEHQPSPDGHTSYSIMTDPSAKQVVWTPGGSGTPLRTWIRSTSKDRNQYFSIEHGNGIWSLNDGSSATYYQLGIFHPQLLVAVEALATPSTLIEFSLHCRFVVEFQGGYSNATLNYTSASSLAAANNVMTPEEIPNSQPDGSSQYLAHQLQRMQTALPAVSRR